MGQTRSVDVVECTVAIRPKDSEKTHSTQLTSRGLDR